MFGYGLFRMALKSFHLRRLLALVLTTATLVFKVSQTVTRFVTEVMFFCSLTGQKQWYGKQFVKMYIYGMVVRIFNEVEKRLQISGISVIDILGCGFERKFSILRTEQKRRLKYMDGIKVCVLRADEKGNHYQGYMAELTDNLYVELGIEKRDIEYVPVTEEFFVISNKESVIRGYPLNRALYDDDYNLKNLLGGNMIVIKVISKKMVDIGIADIKMLESRLRAVAAVSHGFVFTKNYEELQKWKK